MIPEGGRPLPIQAALGNLFRGVASREGVAGRLPYKPFPVPPNHLLFALPPANHVSPCRTEPFDNNAQKVAWLKFIVPKIEEAYGVEVYRSLPEKLQGALTRITDLEGALVEANRNRAVLQGQLNRAITRITECCTTFHADPDPIIREVLGVQNPREEGQ